MGTAGLNAPPPDTVIAGKYKVGAVIAAGGMGVVVEGEHTALGQRVAIKFLLPEAAAQADLVERFLREARGAAKLQSDHVVRVFDMGTDEQGRPFMVMERLIGSDLDAEIEKRGALPVGEAVGYVLEALDAIVEAHAAGIVHRDLKPSNLFLVKKPDGSRRVKVLDFGISKFAAEGAMNAALTSTQSMLGSPGYMSPEQVRSTRNVDARTDVWALGVILYEMLSGGSAFQGESLGDIFAKIREDDLPDIRTRRPDVPEGLALLLGRCVQRDRNNRVADAATLRSGLLPFASQSAIGEITGAASQHRPLTPEGPTQAVTAGTLSAWADRAGPHPKSRLVWVGGGAAALVVALGVWAIIGRTSTVIAEPHTTASGAEARPVAVAPPSTPSGAPAITPSVAPVAAVAIAEPTPSTVTVTPPVTTAPSATARPSVPAHRAAIAPAPPRPAKAQFAPLPSPKKQDTLGL